MATLTVYEGADNRAARNRTVARNRLGMILSLHGVPVWEERDRARRCQSIRRLTITATPALTLRRFDAALLLLDAALLAAAPGTPMPARQALAGALHAVAHGRDPLAPLYAATDAIQAKPLQRDDYIFRDALRRLEAAGVMLYIVARAAAFHDKIGAPGRRPDDPAEALEFRAAEIAETAGACTAAAAAKAVKTLLGE